MIWVRFVNKVSRVVLLFTHANTRSFNPVGTRWTGVRPIADSSRESKWPTFFQTQSLPGIPSRRLTVVDSKHNISIWIIHLKPTLSKYWTVRRWCYLWQLRTFYSYCIVYYSMFKPQQIHLSWIVFSKVKSLNC